MRRARRFAVVPTLSLLAVACSIGGVGPLAVDDLVAAVSGELTVDVLLNDRLPPDDPVQEVRLPVAVDGVSVDGRAVRLVSPVDLAGARVRYEVVTESGAVAGADIVVAQGDLPPRISRLGAPAQVVAGEEWSVMVEADDDGTIAEVVVSVDGVEVERCDGSPCTTSVPGSEVGVVSVEAVATDDVGLQATATRDVEVIPEGEDPAPNIVDIEVPTPVFADEAWTVTVVADDDTGIAEVVVSVDGAVVGRCDGSPCPVTVPPRPAGEVRLTVEVIDVLDGRTEETLVVPIMQPVDEPPVIVAFDVPSEVDEDTPWRVEVEATDDGAIASIEVTIDGAMELRCERSECAGEMPGLPRGDVVVGLVVTDDAGQRAVDSRRVDVLSAIDDRRPTITRFEVPGSVVAGERFRVTVTAEDDGNVERVVVTADGEEVIRCPGSPCERDIVLTALGPTTLEAVAADDGGNTGNSSRVVEVTDPPDTTDPVVQRITTRPTDLVEGDTWGVTVWATDDRGVTRVVVSADGRPLGECPASPCELLGLPARRAGPLALSVRAEDAAGNVATETERVMVTALPNLVVSVEVLEAGYWGFRLGGGYRVQYSVRVSNRGGAAVDRVLVDVRAGTDSELLGFGRLRPGESLTSSGPLTPASVVNLSVEATVDPRNTTRESNEADNVDSMRVDYRPVATLSDRGQLSGSDEHDWTLAFAFEAEDPDGGAVTVTGVATGATVRDFRTVGDEIVVEGAFGQCEDGRNDTIEVTAVVDDDERNRVATTISSTVPSRCLR